MQVSFYCIQPSGSQIMTANLCQIFFLFVVLVAGDDKTKLAPDWMAELKN